jgi:hypothetical protein
MHFFEWWAGLNPWIRFGVAVVLLLISTVLWLAGQIWIWGWVAGGVLLLFCFPSDAERKGYHDF